MKTYYPYLILIIICCSFNYYSKNKLTIIFENQEELIYKLEEFTELANEIFEYEVDKISYKRDLTVHVFIRHFSSDARGAALTVDPLKYRIFLSKDSIKNKINLLGIFAHELGHIIIFDTFKGLTRNHYWDEGLATWLAGKYYLGWQNQVSFNDGVKYFITSKKYIDSKNLVGGKNEIASIRDVLYLEWAAFIDYLYSEFGIQKLSDLTALMVSYEAKSILTELHIAYGFFWFKKTDQNEKAINAKLEATTKKFNSSYYKVYGIEFEDLKTKWLRSFN